MVSISCDTWLVIFGTILAVFLRCCTTLHPYSGMSKPPMYGDMEAQRHWMEITTNLPAGKWYRNGTDNDLMYWGLDYPPLTAYHMWITGRISRYLIGDMTELHQSRGYESDAQKLYMRTTVLLGDVTIFIPSLIVYFTWIESENNKWQMHKSLSIILALLYPGIILIDHGHFQYNSISLGLMVLGTVFLLKRLNILASVLFTLALNYKQMELYHALPFFLYLLSSCVPKPGQTYMQAFGKLLKIAASVLLTFSLLWLPFCSGSLEDVLQVLHRQFPLARGVFEDKVANVWCTLNILFKFKQYDNHTMMRICLFSTLAAVFPSSADLFLRPNTKKFVLALINSSMAFFLFSFQVHEKSILLVAIPVLLHFPKRPFCCFWFLCMSVFSMLPLLEKDGLLWATFSLVLFYSIAFRVSVEHTFKHVLNSSDSLGVYYSHLLHLLIQLEPRKTLKRTYKKLMQNKEAVKAVVFHLSMQLSLVGCLLLFFLSRILAPPVQYPDLWPLLVSVYSCVHFVGFFLYFNVQQLAIPQEFVKLKNL